jgi:hypothetical protein
MGRFFRLKAGTHVQGDGTQSRTFKASDPQGLKGGSGNIVESEEDLALTEPTRWEEFRGEIPEHLRKRVGGAGNVRNLRSLLAGEPPPPGPTSASDIAEAADLSSVNKMGPDELEKHADALIERAEAMKQRAAESRQTEQQNAQQTAQKMKEIRGQSQTDEDDDEETTTSTKSQSQPPSHPGVHQSQKLPDAAVDRMSLEDLKTHAKARNIDLKGATKREDIVKVVKSSK